MKMRLSDEIITVKYQTSKEYCSCCSREFEIPELGEIREFDITLKGFFEWTDWTDETETYDEDIPDVVEEFLFNTISFFALNQNENLKFCEGEIEKVTKLVLLALKN